MVIIYVCLHNELAVVTSAAFQVSATSRNVDWKVGEFSPLKQLVVKHSRGPANGRDKAASPADKWWLLHPVVSYINVAYKRGINPC